jgi:hypothetical protein
VKWVLRRVFGSKNEVMGGWRKLHSEELQDLFSFLSIIILTKMRQLRWAGHVAHLKKMNACRLSLRKPEGKDHKKD